MENNIKIQLAVKTYQNWKQSSRIFYFFFAYQLTSPPITSGGRTSSAFYTHRTRTSTMSVKKSVKMHSVACQLSVKQILFKTYLYRVRHLTFFFSTGKFVNGSTQLMSDLTDNKFYPSIERIWLCIRLNNAGKWTCDQLT